MNNFELTEGVEKIAFPAMMPFGEPEEIPVEHLPGSHSGGDPLLQRQMFSAEAPEDPLGRSAGYQQGIASAIIGIASNQSIATGKPVRINDLIPGTPGWEQDAEPTPLQKKILDLLSSLQSQQPVTESSKHPKPPVFISLSVFFIPRSSG